MTADMPLILIVEDERDIAEILEAFLRQRGFSTEWARAGEEALRLFRAAAPDLVLLDLLIPRIDGLEVIRTIRRESQTPVIMLSARSEEIDKVLGLELGADDYITKPFRPLEVVARINAVLRRYPAAGLPPDQPLRAHRGGREQGTGARSRQPSAADEHGVPAAAALRGPARAGIQPPGTS